MEFLSKISISIFLALAKKFGHYSFRELSRNSTFLKFLEENGIAKPEDDFKNLYFHSLIRFAEKISDPQFLEVFKHKNAIIAFKKGKEKNDNEFERTLNHILLTDQRICKRPELKKYSKVPETDVIHFKTVYQDLLSEIKSPLQVELSEIINVQNTLIKELHIKIDKLSKEGNTNEILLLLQKQIEIYQDQIFRKLNFSTSLELLNELEAYISNLSLPHNSSLRILSQILFLQAHCLYILNKTENQIKFINAYELFPEKQEYREWACISYFKINQKEKAKELALEILKSNSLNNKAFSVLRNLDPSLELPFIVLDHACFKYHYTKLLLRTGETRNQLYDIFSDHFKKHIPFKDVINIKDFLYKQLLTSLFLEELIYQELKVGSLLYLFNGISNSKTLNDCISSLKVLVDYCRNSKDFRIIPSFIDIYWLYCFSLFIKHSNRSTAEELYSAFRLQPENLADFRLEKTLFALSKAKQYNLIVDLGSKYISPKKEINIGIVDAMIRINHDKSEAKKLLFEYLDSFEEVGEIDGLIYNITTCIELYRQLEENPNKLFELKLKEKKYKSDQVKRMLELYACVINGDPIDDSKEYLLNLLSKLERFNQSLKISFSILLSAVKEYKKSNQVIATINSFKIFPITLRLYIENLINTKEQTEELFELLAEYRKYEVDKTFLNKEILLYYHLSDFASVYELAAIGVEKFPEASTFAYYKIISLYYLDRKEELLASLSDLLLTSYSFNWEAAFFIAKICAEKGKNELGLRIAYKYTSDNYDNPLVKDSYFNFYTFCHSDEKQQLVEKVSVGNYVKFKLNNEIKVKYLSEELTKNFVYKEFINKGTGVFTISQGLGDEKLVVEILEITDVHRGLFLEIIEEVQKDPFSGSQMIVIETPTGSIEELNRALVKKFGAKEGINKRLRSEQINLYKLRKIGFSELVRTISNEKVFDVYYHLRESEKTFIVPPLKYFQNVQLDNTNNFVLDLPSVILLSDLTQEIKVEFEDKFIISFYIKEYFNLLLREEKNEMKTNMSLDISETQVRPIIYPENHQYTRVKKIENIINWIENNCVVGFAKNKLKVYEQLKGKSNEFNGFFWEYTIDTIFLANQRNSFLITDDIFYYRHLDNKIIPLSTEFYIKNSLNNKREIFSKLIEYNFIGLTLCNEQLKYEYEKSPILENPDNTFVKAVRSLNYFYSETRENFAEAILFIKFLYSLSMNRNIKKRISQFILQTVFQSYPIEFKDIGGLQDKIKQVFYLLGNSELDVLDDLATVLKIRRLSSLKK